MFEFQEIAEGIFILPKEDALRRDHHEHYNSDASDFYRDINRIVGSPAFRALKYKTQVMPNETNQGISVLLRDRLTHTLHVSIIGERLAYGLGLKIDLTRAIGNSHDLGHTPFGHTGERILNEIMKEKGYKGFNHNNQSLRTVEKLEQVSNVNFKGLNLARAVLDGIKIKCKPRTDYLLLEGQVTAVSDTIAYLFHDIEDALYLDFITLEDLEENQLMEIVLPRTKSEIGRSKKMKLLTQSIDKNLTRELRHSVYRRYRRFVDQHQDVFKKGDFIYTRDIVIDFEDEIKQYVDSLLKMLFKKYYRSEKIKELEESYNEAIREVFDFLVKEPQVMDERRFRIEMPEEENIVFRVKDYIALATEYRFWEVHKYMRSITA